ncbi:nitroreductase/quinone reductase family protein [Actinophytocola oryzae]|uniref:Uncharacterized protein DUF385 n=1 Tax=Actinophytocola oryzae TaxID=502181 RepID=A0A4R7UYP1_9PSEU|nr:nitroreductase/quinone reductase family protein [Actinophytocola oryzae]TDV40655.1 uncharacterized protein DUF385 [Actinophytocola oryzae]
MRNQGSLTERFVGRTNRVIGALRRSRRFGPMVSRHITIVTYTGRRSGRSFSTPVGYRRDGDTVMIGVSIPDKKNWWRNFTGEGGPLSLELDGTARTGHAVAHRDEKGQVSVTVRLE